MRKKKFWKRGDFARLARLTGIRPSALSDYFHRRIGVSVKRAALLTGAIKRITGRNVPLIDLIMNDVSNHPCFF